MTGCRKCTGMGVGGGASWMPAACDDPRQRSCRGEVSVTGCLQITATYLYVGMLVACSLRCAAAMMLQGGTSVTSCL